MKDNDELVQIHVDGIHARQSRMFSTISVPRRSVVPTITPGCIELIFRHHFPRDAGDTVEKSSTPAAAAKELGFRVLRLTIAGDSVRHQILPEQ
jgi:hypothetical protein